MSDVVVIIGDKGTVRVERSTEGGGVSYIVTHPGKRFATNDLEYALTVAKHYAQHGAEGVVA